jgi:hypothetical protein
VLKKIIGEPRLTDEEYVKLMSKASMIAKNFADRKKSDEAFAKDLETLKTDTKGIYDTEKADMAINDFNITKRYKGGMLEVAPVNVFSYLDKLDYRDDKDKQPIVTPKGNSFEYTVKGLDPSEQKQIYYSKAKSDYAFQKGLTDMMMRDNSMSTQNKIDYIVGTMVPNINELDINNPAHRDIISKTYEKANQAVREYQNERKFDPRLIEAAIQYNDQFYNLSKNIGAEKKWTKFNESLYNDTIKRNRDKADEKTEVEFPPARPLNIYGIESKNSIRIGQDVKSYTPSEKSFKRIKTGKKDKMGNEIYATQMDKKSKTPKNYTILEYDSDNDQFILQEILTTEQREDGEEPEIIIEPGNYADQLLPAAQYKTIRKMADRDEQGVRTYTPKGFLNK